MQSHRARKRFSQNFLHDRHYVERIVAAIDPRPGERIVEIGPGLGALTAPLIERAGHITALEIDRDLAARLRERFTPAQLTLIEGDALKFDWSALVAADAAGSPLPLRIVGNLPYHISTPLLFALLPIATGVRDEHFMLQKEVVDRMVAAPASKDYGRLSVMLQLRYRVERLFNVPAGAFAPPPQVQSSIVRLVPRTAAGLPAVDFDVFSRVVTAAFGQRRKTLRNALGELLAEPAIRASGIDPQARAEALSVDDFVRLAQAAVSTPKKLATDNADKV
ncbi:MAG TPA: 16S rRNA (adenine(1518)-N(6)/adenine(1519)-N(6))-dimethyltransferase RsmA [Burkholderiaceae bacterium]|nr:16S rRNA (adenine(1518)-N(6)/adenine(1519)-N(6))-dimethyltransferase RsmA [Burkholderiaceae bacterium]